jgi:dTDP-D-glucose 4,6-dehydratase
LGFKNQISFESGIQKTVEWYSDNIHWWVTNDGLIQK